MITFRTPKPDPAQAKELEKAPKPAQTRKQKLLKASSKKTPPASED